MVRRRQRFGRQFITLASRQSIRCHPQVRHLSAVDLDGQCVDQRAGVSMYVGVCMSEPASHHLLLASDTLTL